MMQLPFVTNLWHNADEDDNDDNQFAVASASVRTRKGKDCLTEKFSLEHPI